MLKFSFPDFSLQVFDHIDFSFGIRIGLELIQIKIVLCHAWPTFTWVFALCWNLVFQTFLCRLLIYWSEIWYIDFSSRFTDHVQLLWRLTYFLLSYCPLLKFSSPNFFVSYKVMTLIFLDEIVSTWYRSSSTFGPLWFAFVGVMPLENLFWPVGGFFHTLLLRHHILQYYRSLYAPRMNVMLVFVCISSAELRRTRSKLKNTEWKILVHSVTRT